MRMSPSQQRESGALPIDDVLSMREKGYDNNQIIQELQDKGFSSSEIFDALNQADMQEIDEEGATSDSSPEPQPGPTQSVSTSSSSQSVSASDEELIEEIIEEKWHDLMDKLQVVIDWKEKSERRLQQVEQDVKSLEDSVERVQKSVGDRLESYDGTMKDVQQDVKAMENAFSDALPAFTENVSELRSLVETMNKDAETSSSYVSEETLNESDDESDET